MIATRTQAEENLLGAVLLSDALLDTLLTEERLTAQHFTAQHEPVFAAMVELHDQGQPVDELTLTARLVDQRPDIAEHDHRVRVQLLAASTISVGSWRAYAAIVRREAEWARRGRLLTGMGAAIHDRDEDTFTSLETQLQQPDRPDTGTLNAEQLGGQVIDWLMGDTDDTIALPFTTLNEILNGGLRPGDVSLVAGWTSMGKSVWVDQILGHAAGDGRRSHAYINEMSPTDRALRTIARTSDVPFRALMARTLDATQAKTAAAAAAALPFGVTDIAGWPAPEIARHIRRHRWDICVVDLFNVIPGAQKTDTADEISATLNAAARQSGTHVLLVCQLNQARNDGVIRKPPVLRDIRTTGQLFADAGNVIFVHRDEEEIIDASGYRTGVAQTLPEGQIRVAKGRNAGTGAVKTYLDSRSMSFRPLEVPHLEAVA